MGGKRGPPELPDANPPLTNRGLVPILPPMALRGVPVEPFPKRGDSFPVCGAGRSEARRDVSGKIMGEDKSSSSEDVLMNESAVVCRKSGRCWFPVPSEGAERFEDRLRPGLNGVPSALMRCGCCPLPSGVDVMPVREWITCGELAVLAW